MCAKLSSGGGAKVGKSPLAPSPYNYKHLMSDPGFLKVKARAQKVQGIDLVAIDFAKNEVRFQVNSVSRPGLRHNIVVQFNSVPAKTVMDRGTHGLATLLRQVGVRVFCSCEAWWYWGFQYKSERRDYNAYKFGLAYPKVRNPKLKGFICKHCHCVLGVLASGTIMNSIAKKMRDYVSEEQLHQVQDALSRIKDLKKL